jgi:ATP-dependent protease Clp ATPase subunit
VRVFCESLSAGDLFEIMRSSEGSLIRQYEREFAAYGVRAVFEEEALRAVAEAAVAEKTGARGLVTVWERLLRDFKFELPSLGLETFAVDAQLVREPEAVLAGLLRQAETQVARCLGVEAEAFAEAFVKEHGLQLRFDAGALTALAERARREGAGVRELCERLFKDYPFGLRLVVSAGGPRVFELDARAVANPDQHLSDLVVQCYREPGVAPEVDLHQQPPRVTTEWKEADDAQV